MNRPVSKEDYLKLSSQIDKHSEILMKEKGEEYSLSNDFLAMENKIAGLMGGCPAFVSGILAAKHVAAMFVILQKTPIDKINLKSWDERIRDAINLLKITNAFVHASQDNFDLQL